MNDCASDDFPDELPLPDSYLIKKRLSVHLERRSSKSPIPSSRRGSLIDAAKEHASHALSNLMRYFAAPDAEDIETSSSESVPEDVFGFHVRDMNGNDISLEKYRGFVLIIVNVASECGLTSVNYDHLNYLHYKYHEKGLRILAFPCNQFGGQEPGSVLQISAFLAKNGVKFDVFSKIDVNGKDAHPLFSFLQNRLPGSLTNDLKWNFTKFLVSRSGTPVDRFAPTTPPKDMEEKIVRLLNE